MGTSVEVCTFQLYGLRVCVTCPNRKGELKPISVVAKTRQGRRANTLIFGFEPFLLEAETMAEELRRICAGSTGVSPFPGKAATPTFHPASRTISMEYLASSPSSRYQTSPALIYSRPPSTRALYSLCIYLRMGRSS
ncbi:hypothetical protein EDD15DRAFT_2533409 [Pisolithus albus]|nr:hypothetical protein EDD15DRAFT_2533409 [Pisolithus albus]